MCKRYCLYLFLIVLLGGINPAWAVTPSVIESRGGKVSVVRFNDGGWQLRVDGKPYFIKGVVYNPAVIGEDPGKATWRDWMTYDDDHNGKNDMAYDTWLYNDPQHRPVGDFQLMKEMGVNTIRLYHLPSDNPITENIYKADAQIHLMQDHAPNKELLRALYRDFGIRVIMGNYLGSWTIGSGATWDEGTDYTNPIHRENIKKSVKAMVLDHKDEPYVLFWLLGNENNIATFSHCNARFQPEAYASLVGELADMIHDLDPEHPVAICEGDGNTQTLKLYPTLAPGIDIIAYNAYRGEWGFGFLWREVKRIFDRPIFLSEFGAFAYDTRVGEDEEYQHRYIKGSWKDIVGQSAPYIDGTKNHIGNSIGGAVLDWVDRWYVDGNPMEHNPGTKGWNSPDHLDHEEWFGLVAMDAGNRSDSLLRRPRKAYAYLKDVWNKEDLGSGALL